MKLKHFIKSFISNRNHYQASSEEDQWDHPLFCVYCNDRAVLAPFNPLHHRADLYPWASFT